VQKGGFSGRCWLNGDQGDKSEQGGPQCGTLSVWHRGPFGMTDA